MPDKEENNKKILERNESQLDVGEETIVHDSLAEKAKDAIDIMEALTEPSKPDPVNSPEHYNMLDVEAIDLIEMSMTKDEFLGYLKGNVLKYIIRYKHKGKSLEDIDKGKWYLERLRDRIDEQRSSN